MSVKLVIYFTATGHSLYRWAGRGLELEATFAADNQGLEDFRAHMKSRHGALAYVLADLAGEDFHEDQIPYLRGSDRQAVSRPSSRAALSRHAAACRGAVARPCNRRAAQRTAALLASFTDARQPPWLDTLAASGARLSGVYSGAAARAGAGGAARRAGRARVVVTSGNGTGLRRCYVEVGRLRFARLERTADMAPEALPAFVRAETLRLAQYMTTLGPCRATAPRSRSSSSPPRPSARAKEQALGPGQRLAFHTVVMEEAAPQGRHRGGPASRRCAQRAAVVCTSRLEAPPEDQFARVEDRRSFFLWRGCSAGSLPQAWPDSAPAYCQRAAQWFELSAWKKSSRVFFRAANRRARGYRGGYERITASFPVTPDFRRQPGERP